MSDNLYKVIELENEVTDLLLNGYTKETLEVELIINKIEKILSKLNNKELLYILKNGSIIHEFITDLCLSSSPEVGLCLSDENYRLMNEIKKYNYEKIYSNKRFKYYHKYAQLIILSIFDLLYSLYNGYETSSDIGRKTFVYPKLLNGFYKWLITYSTDEDEKYKNKKIYELSDEKQYIRSIIDYISGMSDKYIISVFEELIRFE